MGSRQIHELQAAAVLDPDDRMIVSKSGTHQARNGRLGDLPYRRSGHLRTMTAKLDEIVSVRDYGAIGDGVADDAPAFQEALDSHASVMVPAGLWRLASVVSVKPRRHILGVGRDGTTILAEGSQAFRFERNEAGNRVDPTADANWNRSSLEHVTIRMAHGGIRVMGHEFRGRDLCFFGGSASGEDDPDGWCIDMVDANECAFEGINAGYGGGSGHALKANGIRWRAQMDGVNFGDSTLAEISIKLAGASTTAILLDGRAPNESAHVCNNMTLRRIQVNAPEGGGGLTALPGSYGIRLVNAARICLIDCNIEVVETAYEEYSRSAGGVAGACVANTFIGCIVHNCPTAYRDSNATFPGSVIQRNFIGCDNLGPLPVGRISGDGSRAQDGDAFFQGAWIAASDGQPSIQLRSRNRDSLFVTGNFRGAAQTDADGHLRQDAPYHGLRIDLGSMETTRLTRTVANGTVHPDDPARQLEDVRLELGNGTDAPEGELARVQVNDPLMLPARTTVPPRPVDGLIHHAASASAMPSAGDWYLGPGLYARINGGEYPAIAAPRGAVAERERNISFTLGTADFGKVIRVNHASDRVVTIPSGLVPAGAGARRLWIIRQGTGRVTFAASGVNLRSTNGELSISKQFQMVELLLCGNDDVYISHILPDAIEPHAERLHWTAGNVVVPQGYLGKLVRVSSGSAAPVFVTIPAGLVPVGMEATSLRVMKAGLADVEIRADSGMNLAAPGGNPYVITQANKVVTVIVSGPAGNQANTVYIQD
ncbi:MAG: hypothetical protein H6851_09030 [Geminicoccaceae bacterium]|nr:hypothetical protein [Geminicoccaceae bacterium]